MRTAIYLRAYTDRRTALRMPLGRAAILICDFLQSARRLISNIYGCCCQSLGALQKCFHIVA
jgi:hypothetical protein